MKRRRFLMIAATLAMARQARAERTVWQADALGGKVSVDLQGTRALAADTIRTIAAIIEEVEAAASLFRADSAVSRLNTAGRLDGPPPALLDLMALSDRLHRETAGAFDPTVQALWKALAERRDTAAARASIGWGRVNRHDTITLAPDQMLTFNGLAQGYAADRVRSVLFKAGYSQVLVDMGEFAAIGGPFRLGVEDPTLGVISTLPLENAAVATSSPAAMRLGDQAFHILGTHDEQPLWSTVSVVADSAAIADGLSTAFCLMPREAIRATLARMPEVTGVTAVSLDSEVETF